MFLLFGLVFLWGGWKQFLKLDEKKWPSSVAELRISGEVIDYTFVVNDTKYHGKAYYNENDDAINNITVYYDPKDPNKSTIDNDHQAQLIIQISLGVFFVLFFFFVLKRVKENKDFECEAYE